MTKHFLLTTSSLLILFLVSFSQGVKTDSLSSVKVLDTLNFNLVRNTHKIEIGKIVYDLSKDSSFLTLPAKEILQRIPYVHFNNNNDLIFKGNSEKAIILVNGKRVFLSDNIRNILESFPVGVIRKIEVLDIPTTRMHAEGYTSAINIITDTKDESGIQLNTIVSGDTRMGYGLNQYLTMNIKKLSFDISYNHKKDNITSERETTGNSYHNSGWTDMMKTKAKEKYFQDDLNIGSTFKITSSASLSVFMEYATGRQEIVQDARLKEASFNDYSGRWVYNHYQFNGDINVFNKRVAYGANFYKQFKNPQRILSLSGISSKSNRTRESYIQKMKSIEISELAKNEITEDYQFQLDYYHPIGKKIIWENTIQYDSRAADWSNDRDIISTLAPGSPDHERVSKSFTTNSTTLVSSFKFRFNSHQLVVGTQVSEYVINDSEKETYKHILPHISYTFYDRRRNTFFLKFFGKVNTPYEYSYMNNFFDVDITHQRHMSHFFPLSKSLHLIGGYQFLIRKHFFSISSINEEVTNPYFTYFERGDLETNEFIGPAISVRKLGGSFTGNIYLSPNFNMNFSFNVTNTKQRFDYYSYDTWNGPSFDVFSGNINLMYSTNKGLSIYTGFDGRTRSIDYFNYYDIRNASINAGMYLRFKQERCFMHIRIQNILGEFQQNTYRHTKAINEDHFLRTKSDLLRISFNYTLGKTKIRSGVSTNRPSNFYTQY